MTEGLFGGKLSEFSMGFSHEAVMISWLKLSKLSNLKVLNTLAASTVAKIEFEYQKILG